MIYLIIGIILFVAAGYAILNVLGRNPHKDHADKLSELNIEDEDLELRDNIADEQDRLNKKRSKVVNKENKLEK